MTARFSLSVVLALCALWPANLFAQWNAPGAYPAEGYAPPAAHAGFGGAYAPQSGVDIYGDGTGYHQPVYQPQPMPWERDGRSPIRQFLKEVGPNSYFRVEYLSWDVDDLGSKFIGAPSNLAPDIRRPIPAAIFNVNDFTARNLIVPDLGPISFNRTSGLRGTWGIPLLFGEFEVSAWSLSDNDDGLRNPGPGLPTATNVTVGDLTPVPATVPSLTFPLDATVGTLPGTPFITFGPPPPGGIPLTTGVNTVIPTALLPGAVLELPATNAVAIPLLQNGRVGRTALVYDLGYTASYRSEVWGTEAKMILDMGPNSHGVTVKPLVGFRYMSFDEEFQQVGMTSFRSNILRDSSSLTVGNPNLAGFLFPPGFGFTAVPQGAGRVSVINSEVENSLYGLQFGTRAEYEHKWFTLGAEPRVSLGLNSYEATVTTTNLRSVEDGRHRTKDDGTTFAPVFEVGLYGKLHLSQYFSLHAGYNFIYLFQVSRPADNIVYNDNGPQAPPGVVVDADTRDARIQGLTIGGEFQFRDLKLR